MKNVVFESMKKTDKGFKLYFTSYLRKEFVKKSVVISLDKDFTVSGIYISSYDFGSLEWINGIGLDQCRKWETDEQAEAPGYLTRRYTARISDGVAPEGTAEKLLIPDVLNSLDNREIAGILKSVVKVKKTRRKIIPEKFSFKISKSL